MTSAGPFPFFSTAFSEILPILEILDSHSGNPTTLMNFRAGMGRKPVAQKFHFATYLY